MCGIAGFVDPGLDFEEARRRLDATVSALFHRGPDSSGYLVEKKMGFYSGMRRLKIIDLSGGDQPIWNETHDVGVIFNGEIYNHRSLRERLSASHRFATDSDTEVLVHLYEEYGSKMLSHLRGMFAFCIFDRRDQSLFLARDPFGQKPLYYAEGERRFWFASELKALWIHPEIDSTPDPDRFLDYASWLSLPAPYTHFPHISKLAPGRSIRVCLREVRAEDPVWYYRLSLESREGPKTLAEASDRLDHALKDSIRLHLEADVPVGILLSGGLDSLAVAAYAQAAGASDLKTFTASFRNDADSEDVAASVVASRLGMTHHRVFLEAKDLLGDIDRIIWHLDEPVGDPAAFALYHLCTYARQRVTVLLSGEGSDELLAGYGIRYAGMESTLTKSNALRRLRRFLPRETTPFPPDAWGRFCKRAHSSRGEEISELRVEGFPQNLLHPLVLDRNQLLRLRQRERVYGAELWTARQHPLSEIQEFDLAWQLPESLLQKADKMSMAASIELRCPFLDRELARVAASIPPHLRLDRTTRLGKQALRACVERLLPGAGSAPKKGFYLPLARWLRHELRTVVEEDLFHPGAVVPTILERTRLTEAWGRFLRGEPLGEVFYALWIYERWRRLLAERRYSGRFRG